MMGIIEQRQSTRAQRVDKIRKIIRDIWSRGGKVKKRELQEQVMVCFNVSWRKAIEYVHIARIKEKGVEFNGLIKPSDENQSEQFTLT